MPVSGKSLSRGVPVRVETLGSPVFVWDENSAQLGVDVGSASERAAGFWLGFKHSAVLKLALKRAAVVVGLG